MDNIMVETNENGFVIMAEVESNGDEAVAEKQIPLVQFGSILRYLVEVQSIIFFAWSCRHNMTV